MGTPFFLKKRFSVGYRLICVKTDHCDPQSVTELLSAHIPDIHIETDVGSELTYLLKESYIPMFKELLEDFENNSNELGISSFGVTLTTLEEVFLKVMQEDEKRVDATTATDIGNSGHSIADLTEETCKGSSYFHRA